MLTTDESSFLKTGVGDRMKFLNQIEGIWALTWSIGIVPVLDYGVCCSDDLVDLLPDLKRNGSSASFRGAAQVRPLQDLVAACDLAYCLHWAIRDSQLRNTKVPGKVAVHVIEERRQALEWLLTDEPWDEISLDT